MLPVIYVHDHVGDSTVDSFVGNLKLQRVIRKIMNRFMMSSRLIQPLK